MALKITTKNVRITETKKPEGEELDVRYSGHVEFELLSGKTAMNMTMPFKDCIGMPEIMARAFNGLDQYVRQLQTAIRKARTDHGL